jgi:hypothetical protein
MQMWQYTKLTLQSTGDQRGWIWIDTNTTIGQIGTLDRLNQMGSQGWELVAVLHGMDQADNTAQYEYFFKMPY